MPQCISRLVILKHRRYLIPKTNKYPYVSFPDYCHHHLDFTNALDFNMPFNNLPYELSGTRTVSAYKNVGVHSQVLCPHEWMDEDKSHYP